jgi:transposase InsO family protein
VVPSGPLQTDICKYFHDEGGHLGVHRTINGITRYFFWPNMGRFIRAHVTSCQICQQAKATNRLPAGFAEPFALPAEPGAHWTLDFLVPPPSVNGFTSLLVFTDRLSKLVVLVPMKSTTAPDVASAFLEHVFCWFGMPQSLTSDRGPPFQSAVFHEIFQLLGTSLKHSTPHCPHSHGDVERQNRILNELQRALCMDQFPSLAARWDEYAKLLQFTLNSATVSRHGMSPLFFWTGRQPRLPAALALPETSLDPTSLEFVESFRSRWQEALDVGRISQIKMIQAMDAHRDARHGLAVGDWAYLAAEETPIPGKITFASSGLVPFRCVPSPHPPPPWIFRSIGNCLPTSSMLTSSRSSFRGRGTLLQHPNLAASAIGRRMIVATFSVSRVIGGLAVWAQMGGAHVCSTSCTGRGSRWRMGSG